MWRRIRPELRGGLRVVVDDGGRWLGGTPHSLFLSQVPVPWVRLQLTRSQVLAHRYIVYHMLLGCLFTPYVLTVVW